MSHLLKNLIIALAITVFLGVVYVTFVRDSSSPEEGSVLVEKKDPITIETEKILSSIQKVDTYITDDSILEDARFLSLKDYGVPLQDVETGRDNPFDSVE